MGLHIGFSDWTDDKTNLPKPPNPNPYNFKLKKILCFQNSIAMWVNYPDCTNFEGNKILVLRLNYRVENVFEFIKSQTHLDPHFSEDKVSYTLVARFLPTKEGWEFATRLAEEISDKITTDLSNPLNKKLRKHDNR